MGIFYSKKKQEEKETIDKILDLSNNTDFNSNTNHFFVLDYNSLTTKSFHSKTNYSDIFNSTETNIQSSSEYLSNVISNTDMSSLNLSNSLSEWNTKNDLSKTIL